MISKGRINSLVPHTGFPYSRDFAMSIPCKNTKCICHGYEGCAVPSICTIDATGNCEWYQKQLASNTKVAAQDGVPSGDKPPSLLDNASLTLAIAAREVVNCWYNNDLYIENSFPKLMKDLRSALQQQA